MGRQFTLKNWIHLITGDTSGGSKMGGMERVRNLAILLCVTYTKDATNLMRDGLRAKKTSMKDTRHCMKLLLSSYIFLSMGT